MGLIVSPFFGQMSDEEKLYGRFMQDNATAYAVNNSLVVLNEVLVNES
jgi:hypothetical protein